jgi:hypothetical protein
MKPARSLALALALGGLTATGAQAQQAVSPGYPSTGRFSAPSLLPLPQASGPWVQTAGAQGKPAASIDRSSGYVSPVANYVPQPAMRSTANRTISMQPPAPEVVVPGEPGPGIPMEGNAAPMPGMAPGMADPNAYGGSIFGSGCVDGSCGDAVADCGCDLGMPSGYNWYGYVGGLTMTRDRSNKFWTTYETGNNPNQLMYFPGSDWGGGFETTVGFAWCGGNLGDSCDCNPCGTPYRHGIEATYWGVWGLDASDSIRSETNQLSTPIDTGFVDIPTPGLPAGAYFDNAREHRVSRDGEVHNVELNLIDFVTPTYGRDVQFKWLAGARFFKFDEFLQFASVSSGNEFGSDGGLNEAYLDLDVENNLIGAQIGGRADWRVSQRWRLVAGTKVGVFANDINFDTRLYRGDGALATFSTTGNTFDLHAHKTDVSLLAQLDLGLAWDFSRHWSANVGYRAVGISGLALTDDQIPAFLAAQNDWTDIDSNGSMILHGGFAGLQFQY